MLLCSLRRLVHCLACVPVVNFVPLAHVALFQYGVIKL